MLHVNHQMFVKYPLLIKVRSVSSFDQTLDLGVLIIESCNCFSNEIFEFSTDILDLAQIY